MDELDRPWLAIRSDYQRHREYDCPELTDTVVSFRAILVIQRNLNVVLPVAADLHGHFKFCDWLGQLRAPKGSAVGSAAFTRGIKPVRHGGEVIDLPTFRNLQRNLERNHPVGRLHGYRGDLFLLSPFEAGLLGRSDRSR